MTPIERTILALGNDFEEVFRYYLDHGYIYIGPDLFVMAEERKSKKELDISDIWYIQYACGNIKRIFDICPSEKEYVQFERMDDKPRTYSFKKLKERFNGRT